MRSSGCWSCWLSSWPGLPPASYSVQVLSVLDLLATPLRTRLEKTYSAPFATRLYAKESIEMAGGGTQRDFPRLKHGGSHLGGDEAALAGDVLSTMLGAVSLT